MEPPLNQNHHQSSRIILYWHWEITETHHLLLATFVVNMAWKRKYSIMRLEHGSKQKTIRFQIVICECLRLREINSIFWIQYYPLRKGYNPCDNIIPHITKNPSPLPYRSSASYTLTIGIKKTLSFRLLSIKEETVSFSNWQ